MAIGALCTGAQVIARGRLLDGRRCTIHWENRDGFEEDFPEIELTAEHLRHRPRPLTAAGGTASTDLMLTLIARRHGAELANLVADQMIHTSIRSDQRRAAPVDPGAASACATRSSPRHPRMEAHIEDPVSPADARARTSICRPASSSGCSAAT